jgi:hypothetical protein
VHAVTMQVRSGPCKEQLLKERLATLLMQREQRPHSIGLPGSGQCGSGESRLSPSSIALGLTYPDCGVATKLASASVTNAMLIKKSSCPSLGSM